MSSKARLWLRFIKSLRASSASYAKTFHLYDDQFIETCAPWVIPYIGELLGYDPIYSAALSSPDSRAEVANTIGYRRRKGTLVAMEQLTRMFPAVAPRQSKSSAA